MIDIRGFMVSCMAATAMDGLTNQRRSGMMMEDHRGQMVDESSAIEVAGVELVEHNPDNCDCPEKVNRIVELGRKNRTEMEEAEFEFLSKYLKETTVLV